MGWVFLRKVWFSESAQSGFGLVEILCFCMCFGFLEVFNFHFPENVLLFWKCFAFLEVFSVFWSALGFVEVFAVFWRRFGFSERVF